MERGIAAARAASCRGGRAGIGVPRCRIVGDAASGGVTANPQTFTDRLRRREGTTVTAVRPRRLAGAGAEQQQRSVRNGVAASRSVQRIALPRCAALGSSARAWVSVRDRGLVAKRLFYVFAFANNFVVWFWHFTPFASYLPGASLFGFFFRYLTFCTYTLQTMHLGLSLFTEVLIGAKECKRTRPRLARFADDLGCVVFPLANIVTILFYGVLKQFPSPIEGASVERPPFLDFSVHALNFVFAWGDMLLSKNRTFSPRATYLGTICCISYTAWMLIIKIKTNIYPYPFIEKLPFPEGVVILNGIAYTVFLVLTIAMRRWKRREQAAQATDA